MIAIRMERFSPKLGVGMVTLYWRGPADPNIWSADRDEAARFGSVDEAVAALQEHTGDRPLTADATVTLRCDGIGCVAALTCAGNGTPKSGRREAAIIGWTSDDGQDWCPRCSAKHASAPEPPTLFEIDHAGKEAGA